MDRDLSTDQKGRDAFRHVRKWTRNVDLFEKDYVFIPVNFSLHWSLIVICHPGEVANLRDKGMDESSKVSCILHMNSIRGSHRGFENLIRSYLWEEWKERQKKPEEDISKKFLNLDFIAPQLPQQENFFDCGLFLLHYAELFLEQASTSSRTEFLDFLNEDWFHPVEVSLKKRDHIRQLIYKIVEDNALKDPSAACNDKYLRSGTNEGDGSAQSIQETGVKQSCLDIKFNSSDDYEIKGQHYFVDIMEQRNIDESVTIESFQPDKQLVPINQLSNMKLPMQEGLEKQASFPPGAAISRYEAAEDDKSISACCSFTGFSGSRGISKTCSVNTLKIIDVQDEESCGPEDAFTTEREKEILENSSMSCEDVEACVDDSEEEYGPESVRKASRSSSLFSPTGLIM